MARRLLDYVSPDTLRAYPRGSLDPAALQKLEAPIPDTVPEESVRRVAAQWQSHLGEHSLQMQPSHAEAVDDGTAPTMGQYDWRARNPVSRALGQAAEGIVESLPSPGREPLFSFGEVPQPEGTSERLSRVGGQVLGYGLQVAPVSAVMSGAANAARASRLILAGIPAVAGGLVAAAQPGTPKQRLVRGTVMTALGGATSAVESAAGRAGGRLAATSALAGGSGVGAARGALERGASLASGAVGVPAGAVAFGAVSPKAEAAGERLLGEQAQDPTDLGRSIGEMAVIGALAHGAHATAERAVGGAGTPRAATEPPPPELPVSRPSPRVEKPAQPIAEAVAAPRARLRMIEGTATKSADRADAVARALSEQHPGTDFTIRQMRNGAWMVAAPEHQLMAASERAGQQRLATTAGPRQAAESGRTGTLAEPFKPIAAPQAAEAPPAVRPETETAGVASRAIEAPERASEAAEKGGGEPPVRGAEAAGTAAGLVPEQTASPAEKPGPPTALEQQRLEVGRREIPTTPMRAATKRASESVAAMAGEAKSFEQHFEDRVRAGDAPEDARAEAERLSGGAAPPGFDAEARAKSYLHRAAEEAGQTSMFGAPEPTGASRAEPAAVGEPREPGAPGEEFLRYNGMSLDDWRGASEPERKQLSEEYARWRAAREKPDERPDVAVTYMHGKKPEAPSRAPEAETAAPVEPKGSLANESVEAEREPKVPAGPETTGARATTVRAQSLHFHEPFQERETGEKSLVDEGRIQAFLKRHGGYSAEEMAKHPITVWRDEKGEVGPEGRMYVIDGHHRVHLAQRTWGENEHGHFVQTSVSDRELPAVEIKGDYAHAREQARVANLAGAPNTMLEKAKIARALSDQGKPLTQVAAHVTAGKGAQARDLISLSHLDPKLRTQFFGEGGLPLSTGAYLGEFAKRYNVHPDQQRVWLDRLADGRLRSLDELRDVVDGYMDVLRAANQTELLSKADMGDKAISSGMAVDYLGKALTMAGAEERRAAAMAKATRKMMERGGSKEELNAAQTVLERVERDRAKARRVRDEAKQRALAAAKESYEKGGSLPDALFRVQQWIESQFKWQPDETGATSIFTDAAKAATVIGKSISKDVRRGIRAARARNLAKASTDSKQIRVENPGGRPDIVRLDDYAEDSYARDAGVRLAANWHLLAGQDILPPEQRRAHITMQAERAKFEHAFRGMIREALGSHAAERYFARHGTGSRELAKALQGEAHMIPSQFADVPARVKALYDDAQKIREWHAERMGQEPPKARVDYGFPHIVNGVDRGDPLSRMYELVEGRSPSEIGDADMQEKHNRFYDRREGAEDYSLDAMAATEQYFHELAAKLSTDPFLASMQKMLRSPEAAGRDRVRADLARDYLRLTLFRTKNEFEKIADRGARAILFKELTEPIRALPVDLAAEHLGMDADALKAQGVQAVSLVPHGTKPRLSGDETRLGENAEGTYYAHPKGRELLSQRTAAPTWLGKALAEIPTDFGKRVTGRLRNPEERFRHEGKVQEKIDRMYRDPFGLGAALTTGSVSRSVLGWNVRAATTNAWSTLITTLPEYGLLSYLQGAAGAGRAYAQRGARETLVGATRWLERKGYLDAAGAEAARKAVPILRSEVYAEGTGVHQGELHRARQQFRDIAEGRDPKFRALMDVLGPYAMFSAGEGWNRTLSILAADATARRSPALGGKGRVARAADTFESMDAAYGQISKALQDPASAESFAATGTLRTQFDYSDLGTPLWALQAGAFGRILFQLGRWPLYYARQYGYRPTAGLARTAQRLATPHNWFEQWNENNAAAISDRHDAAVFARQTAVAAVLIGLARSTGINFANIGTAPQTVATLWLLRKFFPDDDAIADWYKIGYGSRAIQTDRGVPVGPTLEAAGAAMGAAAKFATGGKGGKPEAGYFPWDSVLEVARRLLPGETELRRVVQEHPDAFESTPWVFKALGVKRVLPSDATTGEIVRHHLGLSPADEAGRLMVRAPQ